MRLSICCLILLVILVPMGAGEAEVPPEAQRVLTQYADECATARTRAVTALEALVREATRRGDLDNAIAIRTALQAVQAQRDGGTAAGRGPAEPMEAAPGEDPAHLLGEGLPAYPATEWLGGSGGGPQEERAKGGMALAGLSLRYRADAITAIAPIWRSATGVDKTGLDAVCVSAQGTDRKVTLVAPRGHWLMGLVGMTGGHVRGLQAVWGKPGPRGGLVYAGLSEWVGAPAADADKVLLMPPDAKPVTSFSTRRGLVIDQVRIPAP
jgi:hypothetical protein